MSERGDRQKCRPILQREWDHQKSKILSRRSAGMTSRDLVTLLCEEGFQVTYVRGACRSPLGLSGVWTLCCEGERSADDGRLLVAFLNSRPSFAAGSHVRIWIETDGFACWVTWTASYPVAKKFVSSSRAKWSTQERSRTRGGICGIPSLRESIVSCITSKCMGECEC